MILCFLLVSLLSFDAATADEDVLLSVNIVIRHADRAATQGWATPQSEEILFRGKDQLSDDGIDNAYTAGKHFRKRYVKTSFIDNRYLPSEVYVRSSPVDRCLMTAAAFTNAIFTKTSNDRPIIPPIRSTDAELDWTLFPHLECDDGFQDVRDRFNLTNVDHGYPAAASAALQATEWDCPDVDSDLFDAVVSEYPNPLIKPYMTKPEKTCAKLNGRLFMYKNIELLAGAGANFNPIRLKRNAGLLTNELINNFKEVTNCDSPCTEYKLRIYVTHDVVVLAIAGIFGVLDRYQGINPSFASALIFETYRNPNNGTYVKIWRKDGPSNDFDDTHNCDSLDGCSLDSITQTVAPYRMTTNIPCGTTPKCQRCDANMIALVIDGNSDHTMDEDVIDRTGMCVTRTFTCRGPNANIELNNGGGVVTNHTDVATFTVSCNENGTAWMSYEGVPITQLECASGNE
ncbi:hypothetical protein PENTCL1PPCAC_4698 [Pristionchus entomophagus]|uniref:acid phosphatase n=1 Tax=Pristionchus entomophagus TaxID=358040 RepID=A0AAV5SK65_9BILA|nr:hypothetical protein PENTCL1PPCAC_4697 [Pristionchus entomophagus]GMS82523.1 hypothetical protein PENTCL1PPCAC_4698 [Pristionchus entomophagus]